MFFRLFRKRSNKADCAKGLFFLIALFLCSSALSDERGLDATEAQIQGIILAAPFDAGYPRSEGVHFFNIGLPQKDLNALSSILSDLFIGEPLSLSAFQEIKDQILSFYAKKGRPFAAARVPEQEITDGIVVIEVEESTLGSVSVDGAHWFSPCWYRSAIRLTEGCPLSISILQEDVAWINRNPFRSVEVICKRGAEPMTTDLDLVVRDKRPLRGFVGTDNTGFKQIGYQRAFAGVYIGNLFSLGQMFSYQYTTDYNLKSFQSHIGSYEVPFPFRHLLSFFGGASFVRAPLESSGTILSHGDSFQASGRYTIPFAQGGRFPQEVRIGCDFKRMNNNVVFGGETISSKNVDLLQFLLEYKLSFASQNISHDFFIETVLSPGPLLPDMSRLAFDLLRPGAGPNYFYVRSALKQLYRLPKQFSVGLEWAFQLSTAKLLASEQFGLGGYTTVRGYQERAVNTDNAFLLRVEPRFPSISLPRKGTGSLVFFLFSDFGVGVDQLKLASNYRNSQALWGVGPGFRYTYKDNISMRFDWGYQLTNIQNNPAGHNRINFGATITL